MLEEDIDGQELCITDYLVAEQGGQLLGACCAWIEGAAGQPSALLKASLLVHAIDPQRMRTARQHFKKLEKLYIMRDEGALQIESVYVRPEGRGQGIAAQLIAAQLDRLADKASTGHAQIILASINDAAKASYTNCGFTPVRTVSSTDVELLQLVPTLEKLLMQRTLSGVKV
nr:GNAT family N-acetyltransferase [Duganella vulcania]